MDNGLKRFALAQDDPREGYVMALRELRAGRKFSHWIWYIFPQLRGLGRSEYSSLYGIESFEEAKKYLEDPLLGRRIRNISGVLLIHAGKDITEIMGGRTDAMKLFSSMTLFDSVSPGEVFGKVLDAFYGGRRDVRTLRLLGIDSAPVGNTPGGGPKEYQRLGDNVIRPCFGLT